LQHASKAAGQVPEQLEAPWTQLLAELGDQEKLFK
jgi:hypothetical protein